MTRETIPGHRVAPHLMQGRIRVAATRDTSVDLPAPEAPTMPTRSPSEIDSAMFLQYIEIGKRGDAAFRPTVGETDMFKVDRSLGGAAFRVDRLAPPAHRGNVCGGVNVRIPSSTSPTLHRSPSACGADPTRHLRDPDRDRTLPPRCLPDSPDRATRDRASSR